MSRDISNKGADTMANAMDVFERFYLELTEVLPMIINKLTVIFYSGNLLSGDHKHRIDCLPTNKEKAEYFLDKVIKPGLEINYTEQFDKMLMVMMNSPDAAVKYLVDEMQKFISSSPASSWNVLLFHQNQPTTYKGITMLWYIYCMICDYIVA